MVGCTWYVFSVSLTFGASSERVPKARRNKARSAAKRSSGLARPREQIPNPGGVTEALDERWLNGAGLDGHRSAGRRGDLLFSGHGSRSSAGASLRALGLPHLRCFQTAALNRYCTWERQCRPEAKLHWQARSQVQPTTAGRLWERGARAIWKPPLLARDRFEFFFNNPVDATSFFPQFGEGPEMFHPWFLARRMRMQLLIQRFGDQIAQRAPLAGGRRFRIPQESFG